MKKLFSLAFLFGVLSLPLYGADQIGDQTNASEIARGGGHGGGGHGGGGGRGGHGGGHGGGRGHGGDFGHHGNRGGDRDWGRHGNRSDRDWGRHGYHRDGWGDNWYGVYGGLYTYPYVYGTDTYNTYPDTYYYNDQYPYYYDYQNQNQY